MESVREVAEEGPRGEAAAAPVGDVLIVYRLAFEGVFEDFLDFGQSVEPLRDGGGGVGTFEAGVDFLAEGGGEVGDFGGAGHWFG